MTGGGKNKATMKTIKHNKKIYGMAAVAVAAFGLASCTNELNESGLGNNNSSAVQGISLVKSPDVVAWSGNQVIGNTLESGRANMPMNYSNAGDGDLNNQTWEEFDAEKLTNITDEERQSVLDAIKAKVTGSRISEDVVFPWTDYFLQDVISGQNGNWPGAGSNGTSSSSYSFEAWNTGADCRVQSQWYTDNHTTDYSNYEHVTNSAHLNNYYLKRDGNQTRINETTLMTNMQYGTYEQMKGKQFRWYINCHENLHWYEYIVVEVSGSYYICFDFGCGYPENDKDGHAGKGAQHNDWDYNDWILKISPAYHIDNHDVEFPVWDGKPTPDPDEPGTNNPTEPSQPSEPSDPSDPSDPSNPETPVYHNDEVEVNYAILDEHNYDVADLVTKLSIHVRKATDVEIKIPIPAYYLIESDDLYIFKEHYLEGDYSYGGYTNTENLIENKNTKIEYPIAGSTVTLNVEFKNGDATLGDEFAKGYILIYTEGITQDVIDACWEFNQDGINFEIYNYFQTANVVWDEDDELVSGEDKDTESINRENLLKRMNKSVISFINGEAPSYYINAFGYAYENGEKTENIHLEHATVKPADNQGFTYSHTGHHLNSTPYNDIYVNNDIEADALHQQHD